MPNLNKFLQKRLTASLLRMESFIHLLYREIMFFDEIITSDNQKEMTASVLKEKLSNRRVSIKNVAVSNTFLENYYKNNEEHVLSDFEFSEKKETLPFSLEVICSTMEFLAKLLYHTIESLSEVVEYHPEEIKLVIRFYFLVRYIPTMKYTEILKELENACSQSDLLKLRDFVIGPKKGSIITVKRRKYAELDGEEGNFKGNMKPEVLFTSSSIPHNQKPKISISRCESLEKVRNFKNPAAPEDNTPEVLTPIKLEINQGVAEPAAVGKYYINSKNHN